MCCLSCSAVNFWYSLGLVGIILSFLSIQCVYFLLCYIKPGTVKQFLSADFISRQNSPKKNSANFYVHVIYTYCSTFVSIWSRTLLIQQFFLTSFSPISISIIFVGWIPHSFLFFIHAKIYQRSCCVSYVIFIMIGHRHRLTAQY